MRKELGSSRWRVTSREVSEVNRILDFSSRNDWK